MSSTQTESHLLSERMTADLKRKAAQKSFVDKIADKMTDIFGTMQFLVVNGLVFVVWIIVNVGLVPGVKPFDPYPFDFLITVVSLEAIFLSTNVLITQNRAGKENDLRAEMDLVINVRAEEEISRIINMLDEIHDHLGLNPKDDAELTVMKEKMDLDQLRKDILDS